ncbi:unnamed protein product [Ascophyllum nodosum]
MWSTSWLSWTPCIVLGLLLGKVNRGDGQFDLALGGPPAPRQEVGADSCWVYTHMNKSGGTTVKRLLRPCLDDNSISYGLYDNPQWKRGLDFLQNDILKRDLKMIWGGYTEGIRPYGMSNCKWFTVFRHPVNRLVSAYFYCKTNGHDALCGSQALPANSTDLTTFAQHWSNFGLRQYALAYVQPDAVLSSRFATREPDHPAWYLLKRFLDGPNHPGGTRVPDVAMRSLLEPAEKLLGEQYAAIGILEEWENSLELFNVALGFPNFNWTTEFLALGEQNKVDDEAHRLEDEALKAAQMDVNIKRFLRLDILLYEQALAVHRRQVKQYGIGK